jgi:hypothetical protein
LAIIDDRVARLLDALRDGGAVAIANAATERLTAMEPDEDASDDRTDDGGPIDGSYGGDGEESPDDRFSRRDPATALRQISAADDVVLARLRLEASLINAIRDELGMLREAQAERGEEARFLVEQVMVVSDDEETESDDGRRGVGSGKGLVDGERMRIIEDLEQAWSAARDVTRGLIGG